MILRDYQNESIAALREHWKTRKDNPCIVLPTGAGKSPVLAEICRLASLKSKRVIVLAHVRELLEQNADKIRLMAPDLAVGIYSAGLGRKDIGHGVTVAGIQSVYRRADLFADVALVIVDEAHLITVKGDGMYRSFWSGIKAANPAARIVGLTATPYRTGSGLVCRPENILNHVCYEAGVRDLMDRGFLTRLRSKGTRDDLDTSGLRIRGGEFKAEDAENLMDADEIVESACLDIARHTADRRACLVFTSGVRHGGHVARVLSEKTGRECGFIVGSTPSDERAATIGRFKSGDLKYLVNVNVLTTGFDAPHVDCIALLRPTMSPGLYYQMCGRGFRIHPGKTDCLVLDFGGNIARHGPIDDLRPTKEKDGTGAAPVKKCPECYEYIPISVRQCPICGYVFPEKKTVTHDAVASDDEILSGDRRQRTLAVRATNYRVHKGKSGRDSLLVEYVTDRGVYREWHCFGYGGLPERRAASWWKRCGGKDPSPIGPAHAYSRGVNLGEIRRPSTIRVMKKAGEKYWDVVGYKFDSAPVLEPSP